MHRWWTQLAERVTSRRRMRRRSRSFTLLELMLALALTSVLLVAISLAVNLHLRTFDSKRNFLEESQLARAVLQIIANDLRSVVVPYEQDVSVMQTMLAGSVLQEGAAGESLDLEAIAEGDAAMPDEEQLEQLAGAVEGQLSEAADMLGLEEVSPNTTDLASGIALPTKPGLYGNQYELQLDVSRLPRQDQYYVIPDDELGVSLVDVPSDVKTVTYYVMATAGELSEVDLALVPELDDATNPLIVGRGLVRRELDRSLTQWAMNTGNITSLEEEGEVLAPEVVGIEFLYFDGIEWLMEWDSEAEGRLPMAVQVTLAVQSSSPSGGGSLFVPPSSLLPTAMADTQVRYYRMVVHLPVGSDMPDEEAMMMEMGL